MATYTPQVAPSVLLKTRDENGPRRQTKEEYRRMKELEEARKAGTVPAMTDVETGSDINPHIPHYIAQAPWYIGAPGPTLKHQKPHPERQKEPSTLTEWYKRGEAIKTKAAIKYRKGACENCGAMTHKRKDCLERPRKIGAKYTNTEIAPDEDSQPKLELDYAAKRDRWNGFDPALYNEKVAQEFQELEEARKKVKFEKLDTGLLDGEEENDSKEKESSVNAVDMDEDKYAENASMPGVKLDVDSRTRITVRNLRIREDTAKYLYNLDPNSAYYDPKSRSMRDNPFKGTGKQPDEVPFAGENFHRFTGEVMSVNNAQLFAWEAHRRGADVHALAEPTKLEALKKEYSVRKTVLRNEIEEQILAKYGGEEHLRKPEDQDFLPFQTEHYVEYNRQGNVIKGQERPAICSSYDEDVYFNNHTSVWGSYWTEGKWGYACCRSILKNSYCTGEAGKRAFDSAKCGFIESVSSKEDSSSAVPANA